MHVRIAGWAASKPHAADPLDHALEDQLPRWDARRALPDRPRPLVAAVARACAAAGWWSPGLADPIPGGLIVRVTGADDVAAARLTDDLAAARPRPAASDFLWTLPSSPAAVVGLALGLLDYQATLVARHDTTSLRLGAELLLAGRLTRVVVGALGPTGAAALALDSHADAAATGAPPRLVEALTSLTPDDWSAPPPDLDVDLVREIHAKRG